MAAGLALVLAAGLLAPVNGFNWIGSVVQYPPWRCGSALPRSGCVALEADQAAAVAYLQAHTTPGEPIFVGTARHDQVFINDASFYFLSGRPSATYYDDYFPGVVTTAAVQAAMIAELERPPVHWVVTVLFPPSAEPNASSQNSGVHLLDDYLHAHYRQCAALGRYTLWQRLGEPTICQ